MNTFSPEDKAKALETLSAVRSSYLAQLALFPLIIAGLEEARRFALINKRTLGIIKAKLPGDFTNVYFEKCYGSALYRICVSNSVTLGHDYPIRFEGDNVGEFIASVKAAEKIAMGNVAEIELTIEGLNAAEELMEQARKLKSRLNIVLPALHYLQGVRTYDHLYKLHCLYIPNAD